MHLAPPTKQFSVSTDVTEATHINVKREYKATDNSNAILKSC